MRSRIAAFVGFPVLAALLLRATPCYADVISGFPDPRSADTPVVLLAALVLVAAVSGLSFVLLRRIARQRTEPVAPAGSDPVADAEADDEK